MLSGGSNHYRSFDRNRCASVPDPLPLEITGAAVVNQLLADVDCGLLPVSAAHEWLAELHDAGFVTLAEMLRSRLCAREGK